MWQQLGQIGGAYPPFDLQGKVVPLANPPCELRSRQPPPVGPHALLVNAQNFLSDTMALAPLDDSGGRDGLRLAERRHFLGHHAARLGLVSRALRRHAHQAERNDALCFPTQPRCLQR